MKDPSHYTEESRPLRFCALGYRPQHRTDPLSNVSQILAIVLEQSPGRLQVLVHPRIAAVVEPSDLEFLQAMLDDLPVRAMEDPSLLLEHLSSLTRGPLVTHQDGTGIENDPALQELRSSFVPL